MEIFVFRDDSKTMGTSVFPDSPIVCFVQVDIPDMLRTWKQVLKLPDQFVRNIVVEE